MHCPFSDGVPGAMKSSLIPGKHLDVEHFRMTLTRWLTVIAFAVAIVGYSVVGRRGGPNPHSAALAREAGAASATSRVEKSTGNVLVGVIHQLSEPEPAVTIHAHAALHADIALDESRFAPQDTGDSSAESTLARPGRQIDETRSTLKTSAKPQPIQGEPLVFIVKNLESDTRQGRSSTGPLHGKPILGIPSPIGEVEDSTRHEELPQLQGDIGELSYGRDVEDEGESNGPVLDAPLCVGPIELREPRNGDEQPWWEQKLMDPIRESSVPKPLELEDVVIGALRYSPRVRAISGTPLIRETAIMEAEGQFDSRAFMESRFTDTSDPVGSTLTTGGPRRLVDQNWRYSAGLRRKTLSGGKFEISQRIGLEDSNSEFFDPTDQANSKLALNFTQPLLNGAGRAYNTSLIVLAQIDTEMANDEFSAQLQDHLIEVTRTYWELYLNRAVLLQKRRLHSEAVQIFDELESRRSVDSLQSQIVRARAAVAARQSEIIRWEMAVRNTESKLRVLVNDPQWLADEQMELLPIESPNGQEVEFNLRDSLAAAMQHRPEIDQATQSVRAATVRLGISRNELKPVLDFVAEAYASGLEGDFGLGKAYGNQFSEGRPSYSVGLLFEIPICNREARARYQRRQLELEQVALELQNVIETTKAEVEIAVRQVETSYREMQSKSRAVSATEEEVRYLQERWRLLPGEDQVVSFLLEDLLEAQERLANEQFDLVTAQVTYTLSIPELQRAIGTLLKAEQIEVTRADDACKPSLILDKRPASAR
jgi:outer membrane protein TolC